jgi:hypothetical protein
LTWFDGLDTLQASKFLQIEPSTIRVLRGRAIKAVTRGMNGEKAQKPRKIRATSNLSYQSPSEKEWNDILRGSNDRQRQIQADRKARDDMELGLSETQWGTSHQGDPVHV